MIKKLLLVSLVIVPFYELFLYFFIPGRSFPAFPDLRVTKDFVALAFAIAIGMTVLIKSGFKPIKNVWIPAFLLFLVWSTYKSPAFYEVNFKPMYQCFAYFFLFLGISSHEFKPEDLRLIFKTIVYCSAGMAVYMMAQKFGIDQIFATYPVHIDGVVINGATKNPEMGGFIGQPTLCAPFVVLGIPFAYHLREWILGAVMALCVVLSGSSFALAGMLVSLLILINKWQAWVICGAIAAIFIYFNRDFLNANGRYDIWILTLKDIKEGRIFLTGAGIGAYKQLFSLRHGNTWVQAHSDWLQLFFGCGVIGFGIVMAAVKDLLKRDHKIIKASVISIFVIALGTFPLQLAVYQFYLTVLIGLIYAIRETYEKQYA